MHGPAPSPWLILPFILLLAAIAAMPLIASNWWEKRYKMVAVALGMTTVIYYVAWLHQGEKVLHALGEYVSFVALVGSLFVVAGGIHVTIKGRSTPWENLAMLGIGVILANILGTTGASMLLLRPFIRNNRYRLSAFHVVFFIFLISNVGGGLTPIGDPPLFIGYIRGIPFFWITEHALAPWLVAVLLLLGLFLIFDWRSYRRVSAELRKKIEEEDDPTRVLGLGNLFFLAIVLAAVFIEHPLFLREVVMIGAAAASYRTTNREIHQRNRFSFHPIEEVAWIFLGIFLTMIPALDWLSVHAAELGINTPTGLFWGTGMLSSFLDNAPTYLNFLAAAMGSMGFDVGAPDHVRSFLELAAIKAVAISAGAVFFGAMSYIGNAPNFMVKSIAEQMGVRMPGFFGYIVRYSVPLLLPVLIIVWLLFFL
jgi:Na+/H+ antiporter NhaD/arsenite permease-like protein